MHVRAVSWASASLSPGHESKLHTRGGGWGHEQTSSCSHHLGPRCPCGQRELRLWSCLCRSPAAPQESGSRTHAPRGERPGWSQRSPGAFRALVLLLWLCPCRLVSGRSPHLYCHLPSRHLSCLRIYIPLLLQVQPTPCLAWDLDHASFAFCFCARGFLLQPVSKFSGATGSLPVVQGSSPCPVQPSLSSKHPPLYSSSAGRSGSEWLKVWHDLEQTGETL